MTDEDLQNDNVSVADTDELTQAMSEDENRNMMADDLTETEADPFVKAPEGTESPPPPSQLKLAEQGKDYVRSYPLRYNTFAEMVK